MKTKFLFISMMMIALLFTSCYKAEEEATLDDYDLTLTYYDTEFDFGTYKTFMIRDSVMLISDYLTEKQMREFYTKGTSDKIRTKISTELKALGYTELPFNQDVTPDFFLNPTVTLMENTSYYYYPGWWWGYPGYWGWYWKSSDYYYYPGYPSWGYSYTYTYETGTLIMEMMNGQSLRAYLDWLEENGSGGDHETAPEVELNWTGHVEGIAGSTGSYNEQRAERGIEEAFEQSPYLKK
jgi:hypothetical protein